MHVKLMIRYQDGAVTPRALVAMVEREVVRVIHWAAPHSRWGVDDDGGAVAPGIAAPGARDRFQATVAALARSHPGLTSSCQVAYAQKYQVPVIVRSPPPIVRRIAGLGGLELLGTAHPWGL